MSLQLVHIDIYPYLRSNNRQGSILGQAGSICPLSLATKVSAGCPVVNFEIEDGQGLILTSDTPSLLN